MTQPIVQIYDIDAFIHRELAQFLCCGYALGNGTVIAASKAHRAALATRRRERSLVRMSGGRIDEPEAPRESMPQGVADDVAGPPFHDRRRSAEERRAHAAEAGALQLRRVIEALQRNTLALEAEIARRKDVEQRLDRLLAHQERAVEEERKRIARELHDELGALLTGISAYMSVALARAERAGSAPEQDLLVASELTALAVQTMRRVVTELRPSVLDNLGVWSSLEWYAGQVRQRAGIRCECSIAPALRAVELESELGTTVFRIVQEALTNVVRHARASRATIRAVRDGDAAIVEIEDDGCGIDAERLLQRDTFGIAGMYERARQFGADVKIAGVKGRGTAVALRFKLAAAPAASEPAESNDEVKPCLKKK